jgi:stage III sporulation protein AD
MDTWRICGLALLSVVAFSVVRGMGRDFEMPMKLTASAVFLGLIVGMARPLVTYLRQMMEGGALGGYAELLLGAIGVAFLTGVCADLCRECRETGVASYVEMAGRLEILLLCIPLVREILETVARLLGAV